MFNPIIQIEVTTRCNSACVFCPREEALSSGKRTLGDIQPEMAGLLIEKLSALDRRFHPLVSFAGLGEPTLYPNLVDLICRIKRACHATIRLDTNCILLKDELADQIIESGCIDKLIMSLILPTEELYIKYKRRDNFKDVQKNMINFLRKKRSRKPRSEVRIIRAPEMNTSQYGAIKRFWGKHLNGNDMLTEGRFENWAGLFGSKNNLARDSCKYVTRLSGKHLTITKEGDASICCYGIAFSSTHPFVVGNIRDFSIPQLLVLARKKTVQFRFQHRKGMYPSNCAICSERGPS